MRVLLGATQAQIERGRGGPWKLPHQVRIYRSAGDRKRAVSALRLAWRRGRTSWNRVVMFLDVHGPALQLMVSHPDVFSVQ